MYYVHSIIKYMARHVLSYISGLCAFVGSLFVYGTLRAGVNEWVWAQNAGNIIDKTIMVITAPQFLFFAVPAILLLGIALYVRKKRSATVSIEQVSPRTRNFHYAIRALVVVCFLLALFVFNFVFFGILGPLGPGDFGSYRIPNNEEQAADVVDAFQQIRLALELYYDGSTPWVDGVPTNPRRYPEKLEDLVPEPLYSLDYKVFEGVPPTYERIGQDDYHLGANVANKNSYFLTVDEDYTSGTISGADNAGCRGELGFACFDVRSKTREIKASEHPKAIK